MRVSWAELEQNIEACCRCGLCRNITHKVPGQGSPDARVLLIGEGPGAEEDRTGMAFVGAAGALLTRMLAAVSLRREDVFIANIVKCRPPGNRIPADNEISECLPFLRAQTALIRPQIILLLGATAVRAVLGDGYRVTACRGKWEEKKGVFILPTYHPAALLRDPLKKKDAWLDLQALRLKLDAMPPKERG